MTTIQPGDEVNLSLSNNERVVGVVEGVDFPDVFSEGWSILALITEGGHPWFGQVRVFSMSEVSLSERAPF